MFPQCSEVNHEKNRTHDSESNKGSNPGDGWRNSRTVTVSLAQRTRVLLSKRASQVTLVVRNPPANSGDVRRGFHLFLIHKCTLKDCTLAETADFGVSFLSFFFFPIFLIYSVVLLSEAQQSDSIIHIYMYLFFFRFFSIIGYHYRLLQDIEFALIWHRLAWTSLVAKIVKRICLQCRRPGFGPWVGQISWRREWLPTPVFLSGEFHELRSLMGISFDTG